MKSTFVESLSSDSEGLAEKLRRCVVAVRSRSGDGSGTAWCPDGLIVTNSHVVPGNHAEVVIRDDRALRATMVARDPERDLAALRVDSQLEAVEPGDSSTVRVGQIVLAAGNPWGERGAVTAGIVVGASNHRSALPGTDDLPIREWIRADVVLAPGNSGGPLADARGRVVGINTMIAGGMAVAVPSNDVTRFVAGIAEVRGALGIAARPVQMGAGASPDGAGLLITEVATGSPADRSGVLPGDILVGLDGRLGDLQTLARGLRALRSGTPVVLDLMRGGVVTQVEAIPAKAA